MPYFVFVRCRVRANKRERRSLHIWSFGQLQEFILYKARRAGIPVRFVDPRNTSRTCAECGCVDKRNRKSQAEFLCVACGHTDNADSEYRATALPQYIYPLNAHLT